jgi:O-antigen/teichoic acid export membrane protein
MEGVKIVTARQGFRVIVLLAAVLAIASPAHAYLDPSTGSMIISAVIGLVAAIALALKMFWYRSVGLLRGAARQLRGRQTHDRPR